CPAGRGGPVGHGGQWGPGRHGGPGGPDAPFTLKVVAVSFRLHWLAELTKRTWPFFLTQAVIVPSELGLSVARATVPRAVSPNPAATPTSRRGRRRGVSGRQRNISSSPPGQLFYMH